VSSIAGSAANRDITITFPPAHALVDLDQSALSSLPLLSIRLYLGIVMSGGEILIFVTILSFLVIGVALIMDAKST
jgi:hypothetical protein